MSETEYSRQIKHDRDFKFSLFDIILKIVFNLYILDVKYSKKKKKKKKKTLTKSQIPR